MMNTRRAKLKCVWEPGSLWKGSWGLILKESIPKNRAPKIQLIWLLADEDLRLIEDTVAKQLVVGWLFVCLVVVWCGVGPRWLLGRQADEQRKTPGDNCGRLVCCWVARYTYVPVTAAILFLCWPCGWFLQSSAQWVVRRSGVGPTRTRGAPLYTIARSVSTREGTDS